MTAVLAAWVFASGAAAQRVTTLGCPEQTDSPLASYASVSRDLGLRFRSVRNLEEIAKIEKLPAKTAKGFAARYGVRQVRFLYAEAEPDKDDEEEGPSLLKPPPVYRVYIHVLNWKGESAYYKLLGHKGDDRFEVNPSSDEAAPATPDQSVPIVVLRSKSESPGWRASSEDENQWVFDFRYGRVRAIAGIGCSWITAITGQCRNVQVGIQESLSCEWDRQRDDLLCTRTSLREAPWGSRGWKERFYVISGGMLWPSEVDPDNVMTPFRWGKIVAGRSVQKATLPWVGDTFRLRDNLVASRGDTGRLWPKFYLLSPGDDGTGTEVALRSLEELKSRPRTETRQEADKGVQSLTPGIVVGQPMSFTVTELPSPLRHIEFLQVTLSENNHHALFWIGVDYRSGKSRAQALLVATEGQDYEACDDASVSDSAAKAEWTGKFPAGCQTGPTPKPDPTVDLTGLAKLDVEPQRYMSDSGFGYHRRFNAGIDYWGDGCPYDVEIGWSYEKGWLMTARDRPCDPKTVTIREIKVSADGNISAAPAKMCSY